MRNRQPFPSAEIAALIMFAVFVIAVFGAI